MTAYKRAHAYIVGVALGDGNLSNSNGRAIRLRITCDTKYPKIEKEIIKNLKILLPDNAVHVVLRKKTYKDVSIYSNKLALLLPWKVGAGSKLVQEVHVPKWIMMRKIYKRSCLLGLLQTDGSIYLDRGYLMVNFVNHCQALAHDIYSMMQSLGYRPTWHETATPLGAIKYTVRLARNSQKFIDEIKLVKS